jgi:hypothetical protein
VIKKNKITPTDALKKAEELIEELKKQKEKDQIIKEATKEGLDEESAKIRDDISILRKKFINDGFSKADAIKKAFITVWNKEFIDQGMSKEDSIQKAEKLFFDVWMDFQM